MRSEGKNPANDEGRKVNHGFDGLDSLQKNLILTRLTKAMVGSDALEIETAIRDILENIALSLSSQRILLFWINDTTHSFKTLAEWHISGLSSIKPMWDKLAFGEYPLWDRLRQNPQISQFSNVDNIPDSYIQDKKLFKKNQIEASIQIPIVYREKTKGFIGVFSGEKGHSWPTQDFEFLSLVAGIIGKLLYENKSIFPNYDLQTASTHDSSLFAQDSESIENFRNPGLLEKMKSEKEFNNQLRILSEAAINLISFQNNDLYEFIGETAHSLLKDAIILVNEYNGKEQCLQTRYVKGFGVPIDTISKLLGKHPKNKRYPLDEKNGLYHQLISCPVIELKGGLAEMSLGTISEPIARQIEKITQASKYFVCGLYAQEKLFGTICIMLRQNKDISPFILESLSRMTSTALHAYALSSELKKTTSILSHTTRIAKMGYWQYDFCTQKLLLSKDLVRDIIQDRPVEQDISVSLELFLRRFVEPSEAKEIREKFRDAFQNFQKEGYSDEMEWHLKRKGKDPLVIYTRGVVQSKGWVLGIAQDVSQIRKTQKQLRESELKFQNLVEQYMDAIVVIQDDGKITEWNDKAQSITSLPAAQVKGKYAWDIESEIIFKPDTRRKSSHYNAEALKKLFHDFFNLEQQNKKVTSEVQIKNQHGEVKYLSVTSFLFHSKDHKYLCRMAKDITDEKHKQEQDKQTEIRHQSAMAKQMFLDNMSHEMRTPLNGIIGMTDLLLYTGLSHHQKDLLHVIKLSSDSLLELISNIHELSRIEADRILIQQKKFSPADLLDKTVGIFKAAAHQKNIHLHHSIQSDPGLCLVGDEFRLQQILTNLIANALKFTPKEGTVKVEGSITQLQDNLMELFIKVDDTGIGIPEDKIPILFERFTQADSSFTREFEGVGIGLSISKELIELMGGNIGVSSQPENGSSFWIQLTLPRCGD